MLLRSKRKSYVSVRLPNRKASFCHKPVNECMEIDGKIYIYFPFYGDSILEDLVATLADGIVSTYLELMSVYGNLSNEESPSGIFLLMHPKVLLSMKQKNKVLLMRFDGWTDRAFWV
ncbi:hypothetical protein V6Z12_A07G180400 [Gossypium hirsutum]